MGGDAFRYNFISQGSATLNVSTDVLNALILTGSDAFANNGEIKKD